MIQLVIVGHEYRKTEEYARLLYMCYIKIYFVITYVSSLSASNYSVSKLYLCYVLV